jgi:hypothetical protein
LANTLTNIKTTIVIVIEGSGGILIHCNQGNRGRTKWCEIAQIFPADAQW